MANNISIDQGRAKNWVFDVETEVELVETLLKDVTNNLVTPVATAGDTFMDSIKGIASKLTDVWSRLCNAYRSSTKSLQEAVEHYAKAASTVKQEAEESKSRIG